MGKFRRCLSPLQGGVFALAAADYVRSNGNLWPNPGSAIQTQDLQKGIDAIEGALCPVIDVKDSIFGLFQEFPNPFGQVARQECRRHSLRPDIHPRDASLPALKSQPRRCEEVVCLGRQRPETAHGLLFDIIEIIFTAAPSDTAVDLKTNGACLHVTRRHHLCSPTFNAATISDA
jgi:hypothetical protein